ncbi:MAG: ABC transporter ATP-binding protein [Chloroflexi bacterium]|nr:ABC transporter ATP-binding protein [Chloroflexota bacterium]
MGKPAVELVDVVKRFGDVVAVNDVSLKVEDGEFFSLLGPSGCGKTTSLRMIAGLETATEGDILLRGETMLGIPPFKRPVNTVFQNYALFPHLNVERNVSFGLEMKKIPKEEIETRVVEALEMVRMPDMAKRRPNQLSGGQQQRIALARALVNRPEVLLLDEPLGALDLKLRKAMQIELKQLQEQVGITFIYVTHDQEEALTMSDRIAVMHDGNVLQIGSPEEIYEQPINRFVAGFIGETNFLEGTVNQINGKTIDVSLDEHTIVKAHSNSSAHKGQKVGVAIRPEKISLASTGMIQGQILEIIYIGTDTRYIIRLKDDTSVTVREQNLNRIQSNKYQRGDEVGMNWDPAHALVLTE